MPTQDSASSGERSLGWRLAHLLEESTVALLTKPRALQGSPHLLDGLRRRLRPSLRPLRRSNLQFEHGRDSRQRNAISGGRVAHKHTPRPVRQLDHVPHARVRRRVQAEDTVSSIHPLGPRSPSDWQRVRDPAVAKGDDVDCEGGLQTAVM